MTCRGTTRAVLGMATGAMLLLATCGHNGKEKCPLEDASPPGDPNEDECHWQDISEQQGEASGRQRPGAAALLPPHADFTEAGEPWRAVLRAVGLSGFEEEMAEFGVHCLYDLFDRDIEMQLRTQVHARIELQGWRGSRSLCNWTVTLADLAESVQLDGPLRDINMYRDHMLRAGFLVSYPQHDTIEVARMSSASLLLLERAAPLGVRDALSSAEWPSAPPSQRRVEAEPPLSSGGGAAAENDEPSQFYFSDDDDAGAGTPSTEEMSTEFDDMPGGTAGTLPTFPQSGTPPTSPTPTHAAGGTQKKTAGTPPTFPQSWTPPTSPTPTHAAGGANSTTPVLPAVNLAVVVWQQPRPAVVWQRPRPATPPPAVRELLRDNRYPDNAHFVSAVEQCVADRGCAPLTAAALLWFNSARSWSMWFTRRRVEDVAAGGAGGAAGGAGGAAEQKRRREAFTDPSDSERQRPAVVWQQPRPATPPPAVRELLRENGYPADAHFVSAVEQCVEDHACAPLTAAALLRRGVAFSGVSDGKPWSIGFKRRRVEDVAAGGAAGGAGGAAGGAAAREDAAVAAQYIAEQEQLAQYIADDHIAEVQQIEREQRERDVHTARQNLEQSERDLHTARQNAWQNVEQLRLQVQAAQHLVDQQSCELAAVQADINSGQTTPYDTSEDEGAGGQ